MRVRYDGNRAGGARSRKGGSFEPGTTLGTRLRAHINSQQFYFPLTGHLRTVRVFAIRQCRGRRDAIVR